MIIIGEKNKKICRNGSRSFFISTIDLPLTTEQIGNVLLRQIVIDSQFFQPFEIHSFLR